MSVTRTELILHIGQHKTGSKALQFFLFKNAKDLRAKSVLYPTADDSSRGIPAYAVSHFRVFVLLRREAMLEQGDGEAANAFWRKYGVYCGPFESLDAIFDSFDSQMARFKTKRLLISAEDLFDLHLSSEIEFNPRWVKKAAQLLAQFVHRRNYDPKLVVYLRRQDRLLISHYAQLIKGEGAAVINFEEFRARFAPRLRSLSLLNFWSAAFGPEKILVRPYESKAMPLGTIHDFFEKALGFKPPTNEAWLEQDIETVNATPSRDFIEFIRILNQRTIDKKPTLPRRWVLEAARLESGSGTQSDGIREWLSPRQQLALLKRHAKENLEISKIFLTKPVALLFQEAPPSLGGRQDPGPRELSPQRVVDIALQVERLMDIERRRRRARRLAWVVLAILIILTGWISFGWEF